MQLPVDRSGLAPTRAWLIPWDCYTVLSTSDLYKVHGGIRNMAEPYGAIALTPPSTPHTPTVSGTESNSFSDVFSTSRSPSPAHPCSSQHPTDIPRLRTAHITAGYREGISISKEPAVQPGFDEGYPLGATFGLTVGYLLGVLEGIVAGYSRSDGDGREESKRLRGLLLLARRELCVDGIFREGVWKSDGTWGYYVPGEDEGDISWREVVKVHPGVKKWESIVGEEVKKAGIQVESLEGPQWEAGRVSDGGGG